jgi:hypothetical protein
MHSSLQHSASRVQAVPPVRQVHTLPMQSPEQQSPSPPQLVPSGLQLQVPAT